MKQTKDWFAVSKEGLKELQAGKPKSYILRELIANAWDENIKTCKVTTEFTKGSCSVRVVDDNPTGFKNLADSFTLFKHTDKRDNPAQRGRFNMGEKQAFSVCDYARIITTKGTVEFSKAGRSVSSNKTTEGTEVLISFKCTKAEYDKMLEDVNLFQPPSNISFYLNGHMTHYKEPFKIFEAALCTEKQEDGMLKRVNRKTNVHVLKGNSNKHYIYEMGIPVSEIECQYDIDVQQKIPLSIDRETVLPCFLKDVYAEVLNNTHDDVDIENSSQLWVRDAISDERINKEAIKDIVTKRFGDKVCIANPFDKRSIDEAISHGYNVVHGSEMSKKEWDNIKGNNVIETSSKLFGAGTAPYEMVVDLTIQHRKGAELAKKIAKEFLGIDIEVQFIKSDASIMADYCPGTLRFNLSKVPLNYFINYLNEGLLQLIIHELGHENGNHTEHSYHETLTMLGSKLTFKAMTDPKWFVL